MTRRPAIADENRQDQPQADDGEQPGADKPSSAGADDQSGADDQPGAEEQSSTGDEPAADGEARQQRQPYNWRRHVPRLLLVVGVAIAAAIVAPSLPHDQTLVFRLGEGVQPVRKLSATWTRAGQDEPAGGVTLRFADHAPASVRHKLRLRNGSYLLTIDLERAAPQTTSPGRATLGGKHTAQIHYLRRVDLEGGETVVVLRQEY